MPHDIAIAVRAARCGGVADTTQSSFFPCEGDIRSVRFPLVLPLSAMRSRSSILSGSLGYPGDFVVKGEGRCETSDGFVTDLRR